MHYVNNCSIRVSDSDIGSSSNDTIWDGVRKIESIPLAELNSFGFNASLQDSRNTRVGPFHNALKILFKDISLEIFKIWQPSENMILIRWNFKGVSRVPWEASGGYQGTSPYKFIALLKFVIHLE
ncbi:unnamed protein product [Brassica rapa subsp. narinosa]